MREVSLTSGIEQLNRITKKLRAQLDALERQIQRMEMVIVRNEESEKIDRSRVL